MVLEAIPLSGYPVILRHGAEPLFVVQKTTAIQSLHTPGGSTAWLGEGLLQVLVWDTEGLFRISFQGHESHSQGLHPLNLITSQGPTS